MARKFATRHSKGESSNSKPLVPCNVPNNESKSVNKLTGIRHSVGLKVEPTHVRSSVVGAYALLIKFEAKYTLHIRRSFLVLLVASTETDYGQNIARSDALLPATLWPFIVAVHKPISCDKDLQRKAVLKNPRESLESFSSENFTWPTRTFHDNDEIERQWKGTRKRSRRLP